MTIGPYLNGPRRRIGRRTLLKAGTAGVAAISAAAALPHLESTPLSHERVKLTGAVGSSGFAAGSAILWMNATDRGKTLDFAKAASAKWIRFDVPWNFAQPSKTSYTWGFVDDVVNDCVSRGFSVMLSVVNCPSWAAYYPSSVQSRPSSAATYATFCGTVATRYKGKVRAIEIWNEPNAQMFFQPNPNAAFYASMVKAAYTSIKAVDSSIVVVAGALGPVDTSSTTVHSVDFVTTMYANGVAGSFDALSYHPYDYDNPFAVGALYNNSPMRQMISLNALMSNNGDGAKDIWLTEYGSPTVSGHTQQQQSDLIFNSMRQWQEVYYAGPMMIYTIRDAAAGSTHPEDNFGVIDYGFTPKQSIYAIQAIVNAGYPARQEKAVFDGSVDASLGDPISPVYPMNRGFGYDFQNGTRYLTYNGFFSSPVAVADVARAYQFVPVSAFANGYQDFDVPGGFRIFSRPASTGTHAVYGAILTAWTSRIGFPTTDMVTSNGTTTVVFENGTISWSQANGTKVTYS